MSDSTTQQDVGHGDTISDYEKYLPAVNEWCSASKLSEKQKSIQSHRYIDISLDIKDIDI